jgi:hypothetical protein
MAEAENASNVVFAPDFSEGDPERRRRRDWHGDQLNTWFVACTRAQLKLSLPSRWWGLVDLANNRGPVTEAHRKWWDMFTPDQAAEARALLDGLCTAMDGRAIDSNDAIGTGGDGDGGDTSWLWFGNASARCEEAVRRGPAGSPSRFGSPAILRWQAPAATAAARAYEAETPGLLFAVRFRLGLGVMIAASWFRYTQVLGLRLGVQLELAPQPRLPGCRPRHWRGAAAERQASCRRPGPGGSVGTSSGNVAPASASPGEEAAGRAPRRATLPCSAACAPAGQCLPSRAPPASPEAGATPPAGRRAAGPGHWPWLEVAQGPGTRMPAA